MTFVNNEGCVQISTGKLQQVESSPGCLQLVEDDSRTVIALEKIAEVWHVSKPTENGMAHSLELYDAEGNALAYLFGSRKSGEEAVEKWKNRLAALAVIGGDAAVAQAATQAEASLVQPTGQVDLSKLSERTRGQLDRVVTRLTEFDADANGQIALVELPERMRAAAAAADTNKNAILDATEIQIVAYQQLMAQREQRAQAAAP